MLVLSPMGKLLAVLRFSGIFEKVVFSLALNLGLYLVRFYHHFIRQWPEELIYLGVICILTCCVFFFHRRNFALFAGY